MLRGEAVICENGWLSYHASGNGRTLSHQSCYQMRAVQLPAANNLSCQTNAILDTSVPVNRNSGENRPCRPPK